MHFGDSNIFWIRLVYNLKASLISTSREKKYPFFFTVVFLVIVSSLFILGGLGCAENETDTTKAINDNKSLELSSSDVKLLADFKNQILYNGGEQIDINNIKLSGSANYRTDSGLAVYKGGVNEVQDPSFEGDGWKLTQSAVIDSADASSGKKSLLIESDGVSGVVAELRKPVPVASDKAFYFIDGQMKAAARTVSIYSNCGRYKAGSIKLFLKALDSSGSLVGEYAYVLDTANTGWQRDGFVYTLPEGTDSYNLQFVADGFNGACNVDAVLSEGKDYFTPYFDGDSENSYWIKAAAPFGFHSTKNQINKNLIVKFVLLCILVVVLIGAVVMIYTSRALPYRNRLVIITLIASLPLLFTAFISAGIAPRSSLWPQWLNALGSNLEPNKTYYYRATSVDSQGVESMPSAETRTKTGWLTRTITLGWDKDPEAIAYRIYRGESSYEQNTMFEVDADQLAFTDSGLTGTSMLPPDEMVNSGAVNASRSFRPNPDVRISSDELHFDPSDDFWVAGEIEFDFTNSLPFIPASFFEIGDPEVDSQFAVSTRYAPQWGDEFSKILLIKGMGLSQVESSWQPLVPIEPGSVIRYVAAVLYQPNGDLDSGPHLWYRINQNEVQHITFANSDPIQGQTAITISKRYFYDEFGNNSIASNFAIVQSKVDNNVVETIFGPGTVPSNIGILTGSGTDLQSTNIP